MSDQPELVPFRKRPGFDDKAWRGQTPMLDTPEKIEDFARLLAEGLTVKEMAETFYCDERTIRNWKKDPRVKAAADRFIKERVLRVARKTDSIIEARLQDAEELDTLTLLRIRKEFLGGLLRLQTQQGEADERTIAEAQDELEKNPDFAAELEELLGRRQTKSPSSGES